MSLPFFLILVICVFFLLFFSYKFNNFIDLSKEVALNIIDFLCCFPGVFVVITVVVVDFQSLLFHITCFGFNLLFFQLLKDGNRSLISNLSCFLVEAFNTINFPPSTTQLYSITISHTFLYIIFKIFCNLLCDTYLTHVLHINLFLTFNVFLDFFVTDF